MAILPQYGHPFHKGDNATINSICSSDWKVTSQMGARSVPFQTEATHKVKNLLSLKANSFL